MGGLQLLPAILPNTMAIWANHHDFHIRYFRVGTKVTWTPPVQQMWILLPNYIPIRYHCSCSQSADRITALLCVVAIWQTYKVAGEWLACYCISVLCFAEICSSWKLPSSWSLACKKKINLFNLHVVFSSSDAYAFRIHQPLPWQCGVCVRGGGMVLCPLCMFYEFSRLSFICAVH